MDYDFLIIVQIGSLKTNLEKIEKAFRQGKYNHEDTAEILEHVLARTNYKLENLLPHD